MAVSKLQSVLRNIPDSFFQLLEIVDDFRIISDNTADELAFTDQLLKGKARMMLDTIF